MKTISIENIFCASKEKDFCTLKGKEYKSSYIKKTIGSTYIEYLGSKDDTQSDKNHHGGIDKAICVYSKEYYDFFKQKHNITLPLCAFGENLSILGANDNDICIGDRFKCGEVIFEVSQPRQPCWKISSVLNIKNLTSLVVKEFKTGFYFRVIKEGLITKDDKIEVISREYPLLTIEFINKCAFDAKNNQKNIKQILQSTRLANAYRVSLQRRLKNKEVGIQDWQEDNYKH